jgi:septal ring factor EnvC (AmiA/AmiB activator)
MQEIFPKVNQVFSYHLKNFDVINCLMSSISLRVEAEDQYERAISRALQKVSEIQTDHPLYSKIISSFKGLNSERIHQVRYFKDQIAKEAGLLKQALEPVEQAMRSHLAELKAMEKDLRTTFDSLTKSRANLDSKYKELDERFILNEVAALYKMNKGLRKTSEAVLREEQSLMKVLEGDWERFRESLALF